ncbi:MAG: VWA domain-containing protein [Acidimicrobiia bacterium]
MTHLLNNGRSGVKKGIILLSDGAANEPDPERNPCRYAIDMANKAKGAGIEIFTIGFGVQGDTCQRDSGVYAGATVTRVLAGMASNSVDNCFGVNPDAENTDGDHFFCEPKDGDLSDIFLQAAAQFVQGSKLVQLPPGG